ncbi:MAG: sensor histidine kinase [Devosia sp.]
MSLARQFTIVGAIVTITAMSLLGLWVAENIRSGMLRSSGFASAILMDSFFAPYVTAIAETGEISPEQIAVLNRLYTDTLFEAGMRSVKLWKPDGTIIYVSGEVLIPEDVGPGRIARAAAGEIVVNFEDGYNHPDLSTPFIEIYVPLYPIGSNEVAAVGEFHQEASRLQEAVSAAYVWSWTVVGVVALAMMGALYAVVLRGSKTITQQQTALQRAAHHAEESARQNEQLRIASDKTRLQAAEVNEQLLGRVGADLHDGPIQLLSVLNFKLTHLLSNKTRARKDEWKDPAQVEAKLRNSLEGLVALNTEALEELRSISAGLVLPELVDLTLESTLELAISRHEALTGSSVVYRHHALPAHTSHLIKTCLYRVVQEALNNSARYAAGADQLVSARATSEAIELEVSDTGPGIDQTRLESEDRRGLGLLGMSNRINAVGGTLEIKAPDGGGTLIRATIPLVGAEATNWP